MKRILSLALSAALVFSTAFSSLYAYRLTPEEPLADDLMAWSQGNKQLTANFYRFAKKNRDNLMFSPLSLQLGLAMAGELAYGKTQQEILQTIFLPEDHAIRRSGALKLLNSIDTANNPKAEAPLFYLANSAWVSSEIAVPPGLNEILIPSYHAELHQRDFAHFPFQTCKEINTWVEDKTVGKIKDLLPEGSVNDQTSLVLINTIYMRAPWRMPFDSQMTYEGPFYGADDAVHSLSYMHQTGTYAMLDEGAYLAVEIPFKGFYPDHGLSLFVVMPKEGYALEDLEAEITPQKINHWIRDVEFRTIDLNLPKFKVSSSLNAKNILREMGMERPFSPAEAEFDFAGPNGRVSITDVVHQAVFEIDETGGTGAAATGIVIGTRSAVDAKRVVIDRPFFLFVADKANRLVLFSGRFCQPED